MATVDRDISVVRAYLGRLGRHVHPRARDAIPEHRPRAPEGVEEHDVYGYGDTRIHR